MTQIIKQSIEDRGIKAPYFINIIKANQVFLVKCLLSNKDKWPTLLSDLIKLILEHF